MLNGHRQTTTPPACQVDARNPSLVQHSLRRNKGEQSSGIPFGHRVDDKVPDVVEQASHLQLLQSHHHAGKGE